MLATIGEPMEWSDFDDRHSDRFLFWPYSAHPNGRDRGCDCPIGASGCRSGGSP